MFVIIQHILTDITIGLLDSARIDYFLTFVHANDKSKRIVWNIIKTNLLLHIFPAILFSLIGLPDYWVLSVPINLISAFVHIIFYIELSGVYKNSPRSSIKSNRSPRSKSPINDIVMTIIMAVYQATISLFTYLLNFIFPLAYVTPYVIFCIWTIYYSMYTYNTLWQAIGIDIPTRIKLHEKKWAYFLGHGLIVSLLHTYADSVLILVSYNIYVGHLLLIPFAMRRRLKKLTPELSYPPINLSIFSYVLGKIISACNYFIGRNSVIDHQSQLEK